MKLSINPFNEGTNKILFTEIFTNIPSYISIFYRRPILVLVNLVRRISPLHEYDSQEFQLLRSMLENLGK